MAAGTPRRPLVIGVTGGIGSGKSTAARLFEEYGAAVIDTDAIARALTQPGQPAIGKIVQQFGSDYLTPVGALDRQRMRERVFNDPAAKRDLEAILHPMIRSQVAAQVDAAHAPYVLVLIPLLVETGGYPELVERVLVVDADERVQIERTMARSALTEQQVRAVIATQASREERLAVADDVIENSGNVETLRAQVRDLHGLYLQLTGAA